jgi:hypothetical protein
MVWMLASTPMRRSWPWMASHTWMSWKYRPVGQWSVTRKGVLTPAWRRSSWALCGLYSYRPTGV